MTPQVRNRWIAVGALICAGAGLALISAGNIGENLVYYWSPTEMVAQGDKAFGPTIRLGGVVKPGSIQWDEGKTHLKFRVADNHSPEAGSVLVDCKEIPPQMFREGIGVVVEGTYAASQVFTSSRLMVNHSNEYRPPQPGEKPRDWKQTVSEATTTSTGAP